MGLPWWEKKSNTWADLTSLPDPLALSRSAVRARDNCQGIPLLGLCEDWPIWQLLTILLRHCENFSLLPSVMMASLGSLQASQRHLAALDPKP